MPRKTSGIFYRFIPNSAVKPNEPLKEQNLETPAHPNVEPVEKVRPVAAYMLTVDDIKEFPRYEKLWKEIFQLR